MKEIDFMSSLHKKTKRDYIARVNDPVYPKSKAAKLAKTVPKLPPPKTTTFFDVSIISMKDIYQAV